MSTRLWVHSRNLLLEFLTKETRLGWKLFRMQQLFIRNTNHHQKFSLYYNRRLILAGLILMFCVLDRGEGAVPGQQSSARAETPADTGIPLAMCLWALR